MSIPACVVGGTDPSGRVTGDVTNWGLYLKFKKVLKRGRGVSPPNQNKGGQKSTLLDFPSL